MAESEHVTIQEAARRCGVSDKTIQRAIRRGLLPAQYPQPNRCEIAASDLKRILPGHVSRQSTEPLENRVAELEQRVADLEDLVQRLQSLQQASKPRRASSAKERTTRLLPRPFVSLLAFAQLHNVTEAKVLTHVNMDLPLLPAKRGAWTDHDGTPVSLALDGSGQRAFYQLYHGVPPFVECEHCPH